MSLRCRASAGLRSDRSEMEKKKTYATLLIASLTIVTHNTTPHMQVLNASRVATEKQEEENNAKTLRTIDRI